MIVQGLSSQRVLPLKTSQGPFSADLLAAIAKQVSDALPTVKAMGATPSVPVSATPAQAPVARATSQSADLLKPIPGLFGPGLGLDWKQPLLFKGTDLGASSRLPFQALTGDHLRLPPPVHPFPVPSLVAVAGHEAGLAAAKAPAVRFWPYGDAIHHIAQGVDATNTAFELITKAGSLGLPGFGNFHLPHEAGIEEGVAVAAGVIGFVEVVYEIKQPHLTGWKRISFLLKKAIDIVRAILAPFSHAGSRTQAAVSVLGLVVKTVDGIHAIPVEAMPPKAGIG